MASAVDANNNPVPGASLKVDRETVKNIFDLFDTDKSGEFSSEQAKKCYELVCGKNIDQKYLRVWAGYEEVSIPFIF